MLANDSLRTLATALLFTALLVFSVGGVEVRAEPLSDGAIPSADELFAIESAAHGGAQLKPLSCGAAESRIVEHRRRMALAQLARRLEIVGADPQGWRPLNGRGYNYLRRPDPYAQMARIQAEAERQQADAATP